MGEPRKFRQRQTDGLQRASFLPAGAKPHVDGGSEQTLTLERYDEGWRRNFEARPSE
jgi:hypothetical protein